MTLKEEEAPFSMPDLPQFSSSEDNAVSIVGRLLNPDCQKMESLILDLPRKWQLYDRVIRVALTKERFQFSFKYEHDLEDVLNKGVHTYNEWTLAIERWIEKPPPDYLQFVNVWVQIRNVPVNHQTIDAITASGEFAGQVTEVAFDPLKARTREYIRVRVKFDVSKPLRRSKVVNLPSGGATTILYDYEKIQKRCYYCQRLTHEQQQCLLWIRKKQEHASSRRGEGPEIAPAKELVLKESDSLFGVLEERQVCLDLVTGRLRIANDVLEEMRLYLLQTDRA